MTRDIPRSSDLPAGYDEEKPYENMNIDELPEWWKEGIEIFRKHNLRPYRPPQFNNGDLTPDIVSELEANLDISIELKSINPQFGDDWGIWMDGEKIAEITRQRTDEGRTVYDMSSSEFKKTVKKEWEKTD